MVHGAKWRVNKNEFIHALNRQQQLESFAHRSQYAQIIIDSSKRWHFVISISDRIYSRDTFLLDTHAHANYELPATGTN